MRGEKRKEENILFSLFTILHPTRNGRKVKPSWGPGARQQASSSRDFGFGWLRAHTYSISYSVPGTTSSLG
jgi:hypothetical protein